MVAQVATVDWVADVGSYESLCPKTLGANLSFRAHVLEACREDAITRNTVLRLCERDPLFFINTFCWLLETRDAADWQLGGKFGKQKVIPFITRGYQDYAIREAARSLGKRDIIVPKSRETGVTWIFIALAAWDWLFHEQTHIGFASKDESSVDDPKDPDSLFSKLHFLLSRLPGWMLNENDYERSVTHHTMLNLKNESTISGYAATGNLGRGGRKRWFFMDEFHFFPTGSDYEAHDSTQHVTRCRVMISTPNRKRGRAGAFYEATCADDANACFIVIDWKDDPEKARGLYKTVDRRLEIVDEAFWSQYHIEGDRYRHPYRENEEYQFVRDGKTRSLYYDFECARPMATPQSIAAELDRNFGGATAQFVDAIVLQKAQDEAKEPVLVGEIYKEEDSGWVVDFGAPGHAVSWVPFEDGSPPRSEYSLGVDVAAGTGGSFSNYSAAFIIDKRTGEQVFEWRSNRINPTELASLLVWLGKVFFNAYLVIESNGPIGQLCVQEVVRLGYRNLYYRNKQKKSYTAKTEEPGYWNSDGGETLLGTLERALRTGQVRINSKVCLREMGQYFFKNGKLIHASVASSEDEADKGKAHGDMAIAAGVAWHGVEDWPAKRDDEVGPGDEPPMDTFAWRQRQAREKAIRQKRLRKYWNPDYN